MLTAAHVIEALSGEWYDRAGMWSISNVVIDSRQANHTAMFVALPGERVDGHAYAADAIQRGARIALVQQEVASDLPVLDLRQGWNALQADNLDWQQGFCLWVPNSLLALQQIARYWRRKFNIRVIGITGSIGKSTTKELVARVLDRKFRTLKSIGNLNNEIGLPLTLTQLNAEHQRAVLEMGFYVPGEIALLCDIAQPQVGVITNVGTVHASRAGSQEAIARGKAELVQALPPSPDGTAILNYDDPWVRPMAEQTQARVFSYGLSSNADLWADSIEGLGLSGIRFRMHYHEETIYIKVPLIGRHSVHTALRAAAVGLVEGLTWQEIVSGLHSENTQLRLITVRVPNGALLLDDTYNSTPESSLAALNLLAELDGLRIAVLGDMLELGQYEQLGHEIVGVRAAEVVDELVTIGELARMIADAAVKAGLPVGYITMLEDTDQAIEYLQTRLTPDCVVLVKGSRGIYMERIVETLEKNG